MLACHCSMSPSFFHTASQLGSGDLEMRQFITMLPNYSTCSKSIGIHGILKCNFPLEEIHCEMPLSLSLAFVINARCERNRLYLPGNISQ